MLIVSPLFRWTPGLTWIIRPQNIHLLAIEERCRYMGVRLSADEINEFLEKGHTGILTTLRRDGFPVTLPTFFVAHEGRIYFSTPVQTKKMARIKNDPRASFLVETGLAWAELKAVMLYGRVSIVEDKDLLARISGLLEEKYRAYQTPNEDKPKAAQKHYAAMATLCFEPEGDPISWDNAKIKFG